MNDIVCATIDIVLLCYICIDGNRCAQNRKPMSENVLCGKVDCLSTSSSYYH